MFRFKKTALAAATITTYEVTVGFRGRTPRTALVTAVTEQDAIDTVFADPGKWVHTLQEPETIAVAIAA